jgi:dipeptidyl aminopeptidase/acylaminoacyl peptidase
LLACVLAATVIAAAPQPAPPQAKLDELDEVLVNVKTALPLEDFVKFPKYESVAISPSGKQLVMAWIDIDYKLQLNLVEFPSLKTIINHSLSSLYSASSVSWASERRLLLQPKWPVRGLLRVREDLGVIMTSDPNGGNPDIINREGLGSMDPLVIQRQDEAAVAAAARDYKPEPGKLSARNAMGPVTMVTTHTGQPDQVLFQTRRANDRGGNTDSSGAYLLNLRDNKQTRVATLPLNGGQFITGPDNRVALVSGVNAKNETVVYYLPENARAEGKDWQLVDSSRAGARGIQPIAWTGNGEEYYALDGRGGQTRTVVAWNPVNKTQRLLYRHASADIDHASLDPAGKPWMYSGNEHFPVYWYPDPEHPLARLHRAIMQKTRDEQVDITNASDDLSSAVVRVSSGRRPPVYLAVNVNSASSLAALFSYPTLRGKRLSQVDPIEFRARDGLLIHGYLTTPEDGSGKPRSGLPLVIIAHDGPQGEPAGSAYEFERQLFASRGYAVLQVNHRGSKGRGQPFERAGDRKWGREVQDDYADGVRWAIKDGVADGKRVCFYGIGYGAFSAMTAAAREPDLFKCVIGVGGIYDLPRMLGEGKKDIPAALRQVLGSDMEELKARSPVDNAGFIKAKVLLMPQEMDEYVPMEQSNGMRAALKNAGNPVQWEPIGQQGYGQLTPETRAGVYIRILRFLDQRIGE